MKPPRTWWSQTWKNVASWHPRNGKPEKEWKQEVTNAVSKIWKDLPNPIRESLQHGSIRVKATALPCPRCKTMNHITQTNIPIKCKGCGKGLVSIRVRRR